MNDFDSIFSTKKKLKWYHRNFRLSPVVKV